MEIYIQDCVGTLHVSVDKHCSVKIQSKKTYWKAKKYKIH